MSIQARLRVSIRAFGVNLNRGSRAVVVPAHIQNPADRLSLEVDLRGFHILVVGGGWLQC